MMGTPLLPDNAWRGIDVMNSSGAEPGIESELIDLDGVPFTRLHELSGENLRQSMHRVVERTRLLHAPYRSSNASGGERID